MKKLLVLTAIVLMAGASAASAVPVIDFGTGAAGPGGSITVSGGTVTGTGILLDLLNVSGAPANNGSYDLTGTGTGATGPTAVMNFAYGPNDNYVEVVGGVPGLNIADGTQLLTGSFATFKLFPGIAVYGTGPDTKNPALLRLLGLPVDQPFAFFGFSIGINGMNDGSFTANSTDIQNTAVPEPGSMLLLGTGLIGLAGAVRRRMKK